MEQNNNQPINQQDQIVLQNHQLQNNYRFIYNFPNAYLKIIREFIIIIIVAAIINLIFFQQHDIQNIQTVETLTIKYDSKNGSQYKQNNTERFFFNDKIDQTICVLGDRGKTYILSQLFLKQRFKHSNENSIVRFIEGSLRFQMIRFRKVKSLKLSYLSKKSTKENYELEFQKNIYLERILQENDNFQQISTKFLLETCENIIYVVNDISDSSQSDLMKILSKAATQKIFIIHNLIDFLNQDDIKKYQEKLENSSTSITKIQEQQFSYLQQLRQRKEGNAQLIFHLIFYKVFQNLFIIINKINILYEHIFQNQDQTQQNQHEYSQFLQKFIVSENFKNRQTSLLISFFQSLYSKIQNKFKIEEKEKFNQIFDEDRILIQEDRFVYYNPTKNCQVNVDFKKETTHISCKFNQDSAVEGRVKYKENRSYYFIQLQKKYIEIPLYYPFYQEQNINFANKKNLEFTLYYDK